MTEPGVAAIDPASPEWVGKIPAHVAIIMDGNGRWARARGLPRIAGHQEGAEALDRVAEECARLGVRRLTVYAFSSENWKRPAEDVGLLMALLRSYLIRKRKKVMENNIRFTAIGRIEELPAEVRAELQPLVRDSARNTGMTLCLALSYGGRAEIVDACRRFAGDVAAGRVRPEELTESLFEQYLDDPAMPPPDLVVRTGGELRLSNFLLWHVAYSEIVVTPTLWPDFGASDLHAAIAEYAGRERRFGGVKE